MLLHLISQGDDKKQCQRLNMKDVVFTLTHSWKYCFAWLNPIIVEKMMTFDECFIAKWRMGWDEISEADLNYWFEGTEETEEMMTAEENNWKAFRNIGATNYYAKIKPDAAFNSFYTCITWPEENSVSAKDIIILRNLQKQVFEQGL